jgi:hypothetical protein
MDNSILERPYLIHAFVCEKVLVERDNVPSYIRAIDEITLHVAQPLQRGDVVPVNANLVLGIRPGPKERTGLHDLVIERVGPSQDRKLFFQKDVEFKDREDDCLSIGFAIYLAWDADGLYWFDIFLDKRLLGRVPLRLSLILEQSGN